MKENELHSSDVYKKYFASLSREEFKQLLVDAGFEIVEDGGGNVIIEEDCCDLEKRLICELERRLVDLEAAKDYYMKKCLDLIKA